MGSIDLESFFTNIEIEQKTLTFNLVDAFHRDENPHKVNLLLGAYRTNENQPYLLPVVKKAEAKIIASPQMNHEYLPSPAGHTDFIKCAIEYLLGKDSVAIKENRVSAIQTISGSDNHQRIFRRAGFKDVRTYRYWDEKTCSIDIVGMLEDLENASEGSVILLHCCAHNPTGSDPTRKQWISIANAIERKKHFVFFDSAYQGFATGDVDVDAFAVRHLVSRGCEMICAQSFSKVFGVYGERTGNITVVHRNSSTVEMVTEQLTTIAFDTYLVPPKHGATIVQTILNDADLHREWLENLKVMSNRLKSVRKSLYSELTRLGTPGSWEHIIDQIGMFSYTGLTEKQVDFLIAEYHIYLRSSGRISLCGLNDRNIPFVAKAIHVAVTTIPK